MVVGRPREAASCSRMATTAAPPMEVSLIGSGRLRQRNPSDGREFAAVLATQGETLLAIEPFGALVVLDEPLGFEDIVEDRRTPARFERRPMPQALAQRAIIAPRGLMLETGAVPAGEAAEAALGEPKAGATERSEIAKRRSLLPAGQHRRVLANLVHGGSAGLGL